MRQALIACGLAAVLALPEAAAAFTTARGVRVNPVGNGVFEVIPRGAGRTGDFWCGAAEYARRELGAGWADRFYVVRGRGVSVTTGRRSAVQFTLDPQAAGVAPSRGGWLELGFRPGDSMSVQQGHTYCHQPPVRP
ncbi:hypothetical protein ACUXV3_08530 [Roseobacteraceae bacterium NS-SX3]